MMTFSPKQYSEQQTYQQDVLASKQETLSAMLSVNAEYAQRVALAADLQQQYGVQCEPLLTSKTIILRAPTNETPNILTHVKCSGLLGVRLAKLIVPALPKPKRIVSIRQDSLEHVAMMRAYEAHDTTMGENTTVAVLDTGVDYTHPALKNAFDERELGYDFVNRKHPHHPKDLHGHGTHVAGIVKAVAPGVTLKAVRVLNENGVGSEADVLLGYEWCYKRNIPVINCSLGSSVGSEEERQVVQAAALFESIIVAAAGNESDDEYSPNIPGYPAWWDGVQSVASVSRDRKHSRFSNMGKVEFAALGEDVFSTVPGGYAVMTGTSMASPCVAGALALQHSASASCLEDRLLRAKDECQQDFGQNLKREQWRRRYGFGIPDCARWVQ